MTTKKIAVTLNHFSLLWKAESSTGMEVSVVEAIKIGDSRFPARSNQAEKVHFGFLLGNNKVNF